MHLFTPTALLPMARGTWLKSRVGLYICCPSCAHAYRIDHDVLADGTLSPSLQCPTHGCTFHDHGKLEGWKP